MKNRIIKITVCVLIAVCVSLFGACSCVGAQTLSFSSAWNGDKARTLGTKERAEYTVTYDDSFSTEGADFTKSGNIGDDFEFSFENGSLVTELELLPGGTEIPNKSSDILSDGQVDYIVKYTSLFSIKATYKCADGEEQVYDDGIESEIYFCPENASLAPVYSKTSAHYSIISADGTSAKITELKTVNEIFYSKKQYELKSYDYDTGEVKEVIKQNYSFKTAIDNNELLFALRNGTAKVDTSYYLPVITPTYSDAKTLAVKRLSDSSVSLKDVSVNGEFKSELTVPVTRYSYRIDSMNASGTSQLVYLQAAAAEGLENRALIVKYVAPITAYGFYQCLGALDYTLTSVTVTIPE